MTTRAVFLFGTLRHLPLLEIVIGAPAADLRLRQGGLRGFRAVHHAGTDYPMLVAADDTASGLLVEGLSDEQISRLDFYEGPFGYRRVAVTVSLDGDEVDADAYRLDEDGAASDERWSLESWTETHADASVEAAREAMEYHGRWTADQLAGRFREIRMRADARVRGRGAAWPRLTAWSTRDAAEVEIVSRRRPYSAFFSIVEADIAFAQFGGGKSEVLTRAGFVGFDAVTVLPWDPRTDRVLMIEQMRFAPWLRAERLPWMLEPVAGHIDPGESPETAARRETREEARVEIGELLAIAEYYPSPGAVTEYLYSYIGIADLSNIGQRIAGADDEGEDIRSHVVTLDEAMALAGDGTIRVAPLLLSILWLARNHADLARRFA